MLDFNIDDLKDDASWRQLTVLLLDSEVSDERLETIRDRLMARLRYVTDKPAVAVRLRGVADMR